LARREGVASLTNMDALHQAAGMRNAAQGWQDNGSALVKIFFFTVINRINRNCKGIFKEKTRWRAWEPPAWHLPGPA